MDCTSFNRGKVSSFTWIPRAHGVYFRWARFGILLLTFFTGTLFRLFAENSLSGVVETTGGSELVCRTDLKGLDYGRAPWALAYIGFLNADPPYDSVAFTDESSVLVTSVKREGAPLGPRRVRVTILDSSNGRILATRDWSIPLRQVGVFATQRGGFVVRDSKQLTLFSSDLNASAHFPLPLMRKPGYEDWQVYATSDRSLLGAVHVVGRDMELFWLDSKTLKVVDSWTAPDGLIGPLSDSDSTLAIADGIVAVTKRPRDKPGCEVMLLGKLRSPASIFTSDKSCGRSAQFLTNDILILPDPGNWEAMRISGESIHREQFGKNEHAWSSRTAANGRRVAVPVSTSKGGAKSLDIYAHEVLNRIMVYDLGARRWVYGLDRKQADLKYLAGFALSPSGLRLAILRGTTVEVYQLPAYQATGEAPN